MTYNHGTKEAVLVIAIFDCYNNGSIIPAVCDEHKCEIFHFDSIEALRNSYEMDTDVGRKMLEILAFTNQTVDFIDPQTGNLKKVMCVLSEFQTITDNAKNLARTESLAGGTMTFRDELYSSLPITPRPKSDLLGDINNDKDSNLRFTSSYGNVADIFENVHKPMAELVATSICSDVDRDILSTMDIQKQNDSDQNSNNSFGNIITLYD